VGILLVMLCTSAGFGAEHVHLAQAGQTVLPPPIRPPSVDQTTTSCQISCDSSVMNCMNNCGLITGAQAAAAPDFRAQCSLSCSSQQLVVNRDAKRGLMTTFTMRYVKGHFVVTGPDVPPMQFSRAPKRGTGARRITPARRSRRAEGMRRSGRLGPTRKVNEPT
jgi:hypothetical protein